MRYSTGAIILHWVTAVLIGLNFVGAWESEDLHGAEKAYAMAGHKAFGITILVLTVLRIVWRMGHTPPPLSPRLKTWEAALAKTTHSLFYIVMLGVPLAGWALHSLASGGQPLTWFQLFDVPGLPFAQSKTGAGVMHAVHEALANVMLALIALHVLGALKHQFVDRDGELRRMWFGKGQAVVADPE